MSEMSFYYHPEYAPDGRTFDMEKVSLDMLKEQGWFDSPAKFGHNIWGPGGAASVQRTHAAQQRGELEAIGSPIPVDTTNPDYQMMERERDYLHESLRSKEDEIEHLRRQLHESKEREADIKEEARRIAGQPDPDHQVQVQEVPGDGTQEETDTGDTGTGAEDTGTQGDGTDF